MSGEEHRVGDRASSTAGQRPGVSGGGGAGGGLELGGRLLSGVFSTWTLFLLTAMTSLVMAPVLVRRLGEEGYGLWALYMAITGYFTLLDFGVSPAIVRYTSRFEATGDRQGARQIVATALAFFLAAALLVAGLTLVGGVFYSSLFPSPGVDGEVARWTFILVGLDFAITLPCSVFQGLLLGRQRYLALNGLNLLVRLLRFGLVLLVVPERGAALLVVACIFLGTGLLRNGGLVTAGWKLLPGRFQAADVNRVALRELLSYSLPAFIISVALRVMAYTDSLVIAWCVGVGAVTAFALAGSLVDYVQELGWGLAGVLVPLVSAHEARGELAEIRERFLQFTRYCVFLVVPTVSISFLLGEAFFTRWVGPEFRKSAELLEVLILAMAVYVVQLPGQAVLKGMSRHGRLALLMALEAAWNLVLSVILARYMGVMGVALGTLVPRVLINGLLLPRHVLDVVELELGRYLREGFVPVIPAALTAWGMQELLQPLAAQSPGWFGLVGLGGLAAAPYLLVLVATGLRAHERKWLAARLRGVFQRLGVLAPQSS